MISKNVMKTSEFKDAVTYRVACDCGSPECDMMLDLEYDKECNMAFLTIYKDLHWSSYWGDNPWYTRFWLRIKGAFRILFSGHIEVTESFVMRESQINGFIEALKEGKTITTRGE